MGWTIIIHANNEYADRIGLFGLLGDEPVQIVYVSDGGRVEAFLVLAGTWQGHRSKKAVPFVLRIFVEFLLRQRDKKSNISSAHAISEPKVFFIANLEPDCCQMLAYNAHLST